ncbi:ribose-5-phosphate isomerase [Haloimpatiens sp. FM7330]|uniref:ribose-5-phosphate isomerase n=1 Tax=Haloimpatiens sp. FM7330 TaxID=3298610 RepID=UPI00363ABD44
MKIEDRYNIIIQTICEMNGISKEELFKILKDTNCKYMLFLLLKKYHCENIQRFNKDFKIKNRNVIGYETKKAKEKFLINKYFRDLYFEADDIIEQTLNENKKSM